MKVFLTGIILAGGKSLRIGKKKAFLKIGNKTFLDILINKLMPLVSEIIISVKSIKEFTGSIPPIHTTMLNKAVSMGWIKLVQDVFPTRFALAESRRIRSSLIGIYSALRSMKSDYGFVIGCDMPSVPEKLIRYLIRRRKGFDVVIPKGAKGLEPLCALYSKRCLSPMEQSIRRQDFKIIDFFSEVKVKIIPLSDIKGLDNNVVSNINTAEDLQHAQKMLY